MLAAMLALAAGVRTGKYADDAMPEGSRAAVDKDYRNDAGEATTLPFDMPVPVAGALGTGAHGSSLRFPSAVGSAVVAVETEAKAAAKGKGTV